MHAKFTAYKHLIFFKMFSSTNRILNTSFLFSKNYFSSSTLLSSVINKSPCLLSSSSLLHPIRRNIFSAAACSVDRFPSMTLSSSPFSSSSSPSNMPRNGSYKPQKQDIYHAGLRYTEITHELKVSKESQVIPIFRVLDFNGDLVGGWESPFNKEDILKIFKFMLTLSVWDEMLYNAQRQGRIPFYIQNQGEEAVQTGVGAALKVEDHLWCQYRELGVLMWRGFTLENAVDQCFGNMGDEGKGRQMPISYTKRDINLQTICTPLTTQVPHAAGAGYAFKLSGEKKCSVAFFGEGAASEGDFHAAMNFAATLKSQTIFVCRNNGYAISTPVVDQYVGDGIAIRALAYGMQTIRVDGNDLFAVYTATKKCREICIENSEPVCIEFMTYRLGHHSTSDDSSQYRAEGEKEAWVKHCVPPIARVRKYLQNNGWWIEKEEEEILLDAKKKMLELLKEAAKKKRYRIIDGLFEDVYAETHWHLEEQKQHLKNHLEKYADNYEISKYQSI